MPQGSSHLYNSVSEPLSFAQVGVLGNAVSGVTAPPKHKGFAITTGTTTGDMAYSIPFDVLFSDGAGNTFYNRIGVAISSTAFFPIQIRGVSGDPVYAIDPTATGLSRHQLIYYY